MEKAHEVPKYKYYADVPTPEEYPTFGKGLVPRKQAQDMQARKAKQRYQPFTYKDVYQKNQFVLSKSVPYYYKKQKPPRNQPHKLPPIGKQMAKDLQDDRAHHKNAPLGNNNWMKKSTNWPTPGSLVFIWFFPIHLLNEL